jgi:hypothetical protein
MNTNITRSMLLESLTYGDLIKVTKIVEDKVEGGTHVYTEDVWGRVTTLSLSGSNPPGTPARHFLVSFADCTGQSITVYVHTID